MFDGKQLVHLAGLPALIELQLSYNTTTDADLTYLKPLKTLRSLKTGPAWQITDAGMEHLKDLPALENLNLFQTKIGDPGVRLLMNIRTLKRLDLFGTQTSEAGLVDIGRLLNLETLCPGSATNLTDPLINALGKLQSFTELYWHGVLLSDADLPRLARLTQLRLLVLNASNISDVGLPNLLALKHLKRLDIHSCHGITDAGLPILSDLRELRVLGLRGTAVTRAAVLALMKKLPECTMQVDFALVDPPAIPRPK